MNAERADGAGAVMLTRNNRERTPEMTTSNYRAGRIIASAAFLPAIFLAVSTHAGSATEYLAQAAPSAAPKVASASVDRIEQRIASLHKKFGITPDQEALWDNMAQVMRANGQKMRDLVVERSANLKTMNAVDDLKSYEMITDEHADGLKRLLPSFEALYASMTPAQQKNADHVFSEQQKKAAHRS
jgi:periplasmic protein CpxP/Spy